MVSLLIIRHLQLLQGAQQSEKIATLHQQYLAPGESLPFLLYMGNISVETKGHNKPCSSAVFLLLLACTLKAVKSENK